MSSQQAGMAGGLAVDTKREKAEPLRPVDYTGRSRLAVAPVR